MRWRLSLAILLAAGMGLAGCDWHGEAGFVEVALPPSLPVTF